MTFRITAHDQTGFEGFGSYIRNVTSLFSAATRLGNPQAEFNSDTATIIVTWDNQSDTDDVLIEVVDDDLEESYFGDISIGNLATAKTVELPMMKMFQSYQKVWEDTYQDINEIVFTHNNIPENKQYVDMDFPAIAPEDVSQAADNFVKILQVLPELGDSSDVKQVALMTLGVNDPAEVLDELGKTEETGTTEARLLRAVKQLREALIKKE